jgi:hypothetical protein
MRTYFASRENTELAPWLSDEQMREQESTLHPSDYARFWLCKWTEPQGSWITAEMYDAAEVGREAAKGDPQFRYVGGVDIGLVRDLTAIAVCHAEGDRSVLDRLVTLKGSRGAPVELEVMEEIAEDLSRKLSVSEWVFEAPQAVASVQRLEKRLRGATVSVRYPTAESVARQFGGLYQLFATRRLVLYPHEQLRRECLNLVTKTVGGRLKVVESSGVHQDCVVALGIACDLLTMEAAALPAETIAAQGASHWWDSLAGVMRSMPAAQPAPLSTAPTDPSAARSGQWWQNPPSFSHSL